MQAHLSRGRWTLRGKFGQPAQVLHRSGQRELIGRTAHATSSQAIQFQDALEVDKQHFDLFTFVARALIRRRCCNAPSHIPSGFMDPAGDLAERSVRATLGFHRRCTVRGIADEAFRLDVELRFNPIDHRLDALDVGADAILHHMVDVMTPKIGTK